MRSREKWCSLTAEEQLAYRTERQLNKKLARELKEQPKDSLTDEQKAFLSEHLPISGSRKRKLRIEEGSNICREKTLKYSMNSEKVLKELCSTISSSKKIVCIDVEQHEYTKKITEVGISTYSHETREVSTVHYIIEEYYHHRNGKRVADNKDNFNYGSSKMISIVELKDILNSHTRGACFIAGHAFSNDIQMLGEILTIKGIKILDTQYFAKYYFKDPQTFSLETLLKTFKIYYENLHNAGNDAYYTLQCLLSMRQFR